SVMILFFFFQAEDGIRDRNVTGVQTCALPISDSICDKAKIRDGCAYLTEVASEAAGSEIGVLGNSQTMLIHGTALHGLSRVYDLTGEEKYLELSTKLKNLLLKPEYWVPEPAPKATVAGEHGQFE